MSDPDAPDDDLPTSLDDPDWVDRIVARAMESAEKGGSSVHDSPAITPNESADVPASEPTGAEPVTTREATPEPRTEPGAPAARKAAAPTQAREPAAHQRVTQAPDAQPPLDLEPTTRRRPEPADVASTEPQWPDSESGRAVPVASTVAASTVFDQTGDPNLPLQIEPDDTDEGKSAGRNRALIEWIAVIAGAIAVAFLVKTFLLQAFYIPSSSMEPTLEINDRVLVNKLSYDFNDISRGDLVVFDRPENLATDTDDLIKRVVGLPGETLELIDGKVFIDGRGLNEPYVGEQPTNWLGFDDTARELCGGDDLCTIPENYVFVMGDNRTGSTDSRRFGPIPEGNVVGRAFLRIWPLNSIGWL